MTVLAKASSNLTDLPTELGLSWLRVTVMRSEKLVTEAGRVPDPRGRGTCAIGSGYRATDSKD
jgi:hypothetical protein